jgi:hypothetical protein
MPIQRLISTAAPAASTTAAASAPGASTGAGAAPAPAADAAPYTERFARWSKTNEARLKESAPGKTRNRSFYASKLKGLVCSRHTANPPVIAFGADNAAWGLESAQEFVSLLYMQKAEWLNPDKIDKVELAQAVYEVLAKNPEGAVDAYLKAIHFPRSLEDVKDDFGHGAGYYAHRWRPLAFDSAGNLVGCVLPFVLNHDALASLHVLRDVLAALQAWFGMTTGLERASHFKDRETAAASVVAKTLDIFSKAPSPWEAKEIGRQLREIAPQLEAELRAAFAHGDAGDLCRVGPKTEQFEQDIGKVKAHLYNKAAELKGNERSIQYRAASSAVKLTGGIAALGAAKGGPAAAGIAAATLALSSIPHLVYHLTDAGVDDARAKGMATLENNLKMVDQWINTTEFSAQEIAATYDAYYRGLISRQQCADALSRAFNMKAVCGLTELMGGVQASVANKLLEGQLAKTIGQMVCAHKKATSAGLPPCVREHYRKATQRYEQKAERLFQDLCHLKGMSHHIEQALRANTEEATVQSLDEASAALHRIQDQDVHTLLTSRSLEQQADVMGKARTLNRDDMFKYGISYGVNNIAELAATGATFGLSTHTAANLLAGQDTGPKRYGVAGMLSALTGPASYTVSGQRTNMKDAHGAPRAQLQQVAWQPSGVRPAFAVALDAAAPGAHSGPSVIQTLRNIRDHGATPDKLAVDAGAFQYEIDFTKTQPYSDERQAAMRLRDKGRLKAENGKIALRLFWVALRALGTDRAKTHLKAIKEERARIFSLKGDVRNKLRQENGALLSKALQDAAATDLSTVSMDDFMRALNDGLAPPLPTRVHRVPPVMPEAMSRLLDGHAGNATHLVLRTSDGRFLCASRPGIGQPWTVEAPGGRGAPLGEFFASQQCELQEIGVIPFTWREDLPAQLGALPLNLEAQRVFQDAISAGGGRIQSMWSAVHWSPADFDLIAKFLGDD